MPLHNYDTNELPIIEEFSQLHNNNLICRFESERSYNDYRDQTKTYYLFSFLLSSICPFLHRVGERNNKREGRKETIKGLVNGGRKHVIINSSVFPFLSG